MNADQTVNCYFCGELFDETECIAADDYNDNDGGSICEVCLQKKMWLRREFLESEFNDIKVVR